MTWKKVLKFKPKENRLHLIPPEDLQELTSKVIDVSLEFGEKILDLVQEHFESGEELKIIANKVGLLKENIKILLELRHIRVRRNEVDERIKI